MKNINKEELLHAFKFAFPLTIPVLIGYLFLGLAYGFYMVAKGFHTGLALFMSLFTYSGGLQYLAVSLFMSADFNPLYAFVLGLTVNSRMAFYGISMLSKYRRMGIVKPFLIFTLSDETFSILCSLRVPQHLNKKYFYFAVSFINYVYWFIGTLLGCLLGEIIKFDTTGLDFVLTALFLVIFLDQWMDNKDHRAAIIGVLCSLPILVLKTNSSIILSMILILVVITLLFVLKEHNNLEYEEDDEQ